MESCCECGADYPRSDLIAGEIYCPACRAAEAERESRQRRDKEQDRIVDSLIAKYREQMET